MKIVVGLGNYEPKYDHTYHNIGFDVVERKCVRVWWRNVALAEKNFCL